MDYEEWAATVERGVTINPQMAFAAGAASRDAEIRELVTALEGVPSLITVMRMPNIEHVADNHNRAVHGLRQALAKVPE